MTAKEMATALCERGIRPTPQRLAVYEFLCLHPVHPSADTVYEAVVEQNPHFSRTTVYNSLRALMQAGLVQELSMDTEEKHYDANVSLHGHFHCRHCGAITDFPLEPTMVQSLTPDGYTALGQGIYLSGICPACQPQ